MWTNASKQLKEKTTMVTKPMMTTLAAVVVLLLLPFQASGQTTAPARTKPTTVPLDGILPEMRFDGQTLDEVIEYIQTIVPDFNAVIIRPPGMPADQPTVPRMTLKNVTLLQLLQVLEASASTKVDIIDGESGPVYTLRLLPNPWEVARGPGSRAETVVRVFALGDIVNSMAQTRNGEPKDRQKTAMNDLLSLVQAALEQAGGDDTPVLQIHEATQTLVFKGTKAQLEIVAQALAALPKPSETEVRQQRDDAWNNLEQTRNQLAEAQKALASSETENSIRKAQVEQLEQALRSATAASAGATRSAATKPKE
jgi:hypothetical protein